MLFRNLTLIPEQPAKRLERGGFWERKGGGSFGGEMEPKIALFIISLVILFGFLNHVHALM